MSTKGIFEATLGVAPSGRRVALYDVADLMPRHKVKAYNPRPVEAIRAQYVHHSGRLRQGDPFAHMYGSARFVIRKHGWPGFAYTTWVPFWDTYDDDGARVVYRGNPDELATYHAGAGPNAKAVAHCLQGNLTKRDMSEHQAECLPLLLAYFAKRLGINPTPTGHFQADRHDGHAKATCPGRAGIGWVLGYQAGRESRRNGSPWA